MFKFNLAARLTAITLFATAAIPLIYSPDHAKVRSLKICNKSHEKVSVALAQKSGNQRITLGSWKIDSGNCQKLVNWIIKYRTYGIYATSNLGKKWLERIMHNKSIGTFFILLGISILFPQSIPILEIMIPIIKLIEKIYDIQNPYQEPESKNYRQEYPVVNPVAKSPSLNLSKSSKKLEYISGKKVSLYGRSGQFHGEVEKIRIQQKPSSQDSGVVAIICWNDGIKSNVLFLESSRVRVWKNNVEYGGKWYWDTEGYLRIKIDRGSKYIFN